MKWKKISYWKFSRFSHSFLIATSENTTEENNLKFFKWNKENLSDLKKINELKESGKNTHDQSQINWANRKLFEKENSKDFS